MNTRCQPFTPALRRHWGFERVGARFELLLPVALLAFFAPLASARDTIGGSAGAHGAGAAGASAATSQTATAATAATAQAAQAAITAKRSQDSFIKAAAAFQSMQAAQAQARAAALAGPNHLIGTTDVPDGLGVGGLNPVGFNSTPLSGSAIQVIQLNSGGKNQLALGGSGSVTLPNGTPGGDQITVTGAGTSSGGSVTTTAGSVMTTTGGTLATTSGGTISLTAGSGTLTATTSTTLTSTIAGTVTLPAGGGTVPLAANQAATLPAGSTVSFTGTTAGTVNVTGAGTVALNGAGTLALANATATSSGGTITTNSGTTSFTSGGLVSSLPAGSQIKLIGSGTISLTGTTDGSTVAALPVIVPSSSNASTFNFSTTGTVLSTQSYAVPSSGSYAWTGVGALSQSTGDGLFTDTITQNAPAALLYWSSFNIGKKTTLNFDQSAGGANAGSWVAINQIVNDPSLAPSQILGSIQAPGQVYVINQNGIIFGGSSQVNTHALVASSLPINTNLTNPEFLLGGASTDNQFLFSQLPVPQIGSLPTFTPPTEPVDGNGAVVGDGDVVVQPGAILQAPTTAEHVGGKIALLGPVVRNEGTISTPDGQTILAAGLQVGFNAHAQTDPSLRGLDVFVGGVADSTAGLTQNANGVAYGTVTNAGVIESPRADIMLAGKDVEQNGIIDSLTSVSLNGRIDLLADFNVKLTINNNNGVNETAFTQIDTGTVNLGTNSLTQILPDSSPATVVGTSLALASLVNIEGQNINMASGAQLLAPGAKATPPSFDKSSPPVELTIGSVDLTGTALTSGVNLDAGAWVVGVGVVSQLAPTTGSVNLDSGATIDVSGSQNVAASVSENIIAAQLRGTELANSPLQQNGPLRGQTVDIDIRQTGVYNGQAWIGSPIGDLSGYAGLVQHTAAELTVNGGSVGIQAGTHVNIAADATVNVSGGSINYQAATISTTKVVTADGRILDISKATPDQIYQGLDTGFTVSSPKWGVTQTFSGTFANTSTYDPGYIQGGNGGSLTISSPAVTLKGNLFGNTVAGANQVLATKLTSQLNATFQNSNSDSQELGLSQFANANFAGSDFLPILVPIKGVPTAGSLILNLFPDTSGQAIQPQDVVFQATTGPRALDPFAASGNPQLDLSADLVGADGFSHLTIDGNLPTGTNFNAATLPIAISTAGNIAVPAGVTLTTQPGGSITLASVNLDIESSISAPGGSLSFTAQNVIPSQAANATAPLQPVDGRGNFTLGNGATLSTAGLIVNNQATAPNANTQPQVVDGGTITIKGYNANLQAGTSIDASGGVLVGLDGKPTYGAGGKIDIEAGQDPFVDSAHNFAIVGGQLNLGSTLSAYSGKTGGSLVVLAPSIQIGGLVLENGDASALPIVQENNLISGNGTTLWLDRTGSPDFFSQGGFGSYSLIGLGLAPVTYANGVAQTLNPFASTPGVVLASGLNLNPVAQSYQEVVSSAGLDLATTTYALASQRTPVSLAFNASGVTGGSSVGGNPVVRGDLIMSATASIQTDPLASVTLKGQSVAVLGKVYAPGGAITVSGAADSTNLFAASNLVTTVDLGPGSVLSTAGTVETTFNGFGYATGNVLNGGTITVSGNIVGEAGSLLDVSGTSGVLDVTPGAAGLSSTGFKPGQLVAMQESSNAGSIVLGATIVNGQLANIGQELFVDSTLVGVAGPGAQGGSLTISNGYPIPAPNNQTPQDVSLVVTSSGPSRAASSPTGQAVIGQVVTPDHPMNDVDGVPVLGYFAANSNLFVNQTSDASLANNHGLAGGFSSLTLDASVQFSGPVSITTSRSLIVANNPAFSNSFNVTSGGVINADSAVSLNSAYVRLGLPFTGPGGKPLIVQPTVGSSPGTLSVTATKLMDIGNLTLENIDQLNLGSLGDIRGDGTLNTTGNVSITAGQLYPVTESTFTIAAFDPQNGHSQVTLAGTSNLPPLPLSAGGILNIFADTITQGGVLRAPMGTINLGSLAPPAGSGLPTTTAVTLAAGSTTSVSAVDPNTGIGLSIPYGAIDNSGNWNDPAGNPLTAGSTPTLPAKSINLSAGTISIASDASTNGSQSTLDISGGGDLLASQFISGTGGTNDILGSTTSFAIVPSANQAGFAPYDVVSGYATSAYANLQVGDQIYLAASNGLAAGNYTLLPSRYAVLPGAFLITPKSGTPLTASTTQLDGSALVSGYRVSSLDSSRAQAVGTLFEVDSQQVIGARATYVTSSANTFFAQSAAALGHATPRLPNDAGQLVLNAANALTLSSAARTLASQAGNGGLGSIVDIATTADINIGNTVVAGDLNLDPAGLTALNAGSLLIGGSRNSAGTTATVTTGSLTVNNQGGAALLANDLILVSNGSLQIQDGSTLEASAGSTSAQPLAIVNGSSGTPNSDGALVRVSSSSTNATTRLDAIDLTDPAPKLTIGQNVSISGASLALDSTGFADVIDPSATLLATGTASISSGQISLILDHSQPATGLVLSGAALTKLQNSVQALSLLSYSSLDIYGSGAIGGAQVQSLALHAAEIRGFNNAGQQVSISAQNVLLDNGAKGTAPGPVQTPAAGSSLAINAGTITLGVNPLAVDQYAQVTLTATNAIVLSNGTGSLTTAGDLSLMTPLLTAAPIVPLTPNQELAGQTPATATTQTISASGALIISGTGDAMPTLSEGLGAHLTLAGTSVTADTNIQLPSGTLALVATNGDVTVGGNLNAGGTQKTIYSLTEYTSGGQVSLTSYTGNVNLSSGSTINVSAQPGGGNAGSVTINASAGTFTFAGSNLLGQGGAGGQGGTFSLDVGSLAGASLSPLEQALNPVVSGAVLGDTYVGGFTQGQSIRLRTGDATLDGITATNAFNLSTDAGSITVSGLIASNSGTSSASMDVTTQANDGGAMVLAHPGATGGAISLAANGSVTLLSGSLLSVAAQNVNDAGKGGSITLEAGAETGGSSTATSSRDAGTQKFADTAIDVRAGSVIDLSLQANSTTIDGAAITGATTTGTLHLRAPQASNGTDVRIDPLMGTIVTAPLVNNGLVGSPSNIVVEGFKIYTPTNGLIDSSIEGSTASTANDGTVFGDAAGFVGNAVTIVSQLVSGTPNSANAALFQVTPGAEIVNPSGDLTLASDWDLSTFRFGPNNVGGDLTLRASGNLVIDFGASLSDGFTANPINSLAAFGLWTDVLMPAGSQSWSYRLVAGADFGAADYRQVLPARQANALVPSSPTALAANSGSILIGVGTVANTNTALKTQQIMGSVSSSGLGFFQTIRTGTGDISMVSGGDVQLLNNVATIYTAGTQVPQTVLTGVVNIQSVQAYNPSNNTTAVLLAPATLPTGFGVGSAFLGSTVQSIVGNVVTLAGNSNVNVSTITPESFDGSTGVVGVASSSTGSSTVTLATQPPGFGAGATFLGARVLSVSGQTVTLQGNVTSTDANVAEAYSYSTPLVGFDVPNLTNPRVGGASTSNSNYNFAVGTNTQAQYSQHGGNLTIFAQGNIAHNTAIDNGDGTTTLVDDSSQELPTNWLLRRGYQVSGLFGNNAGKTPEVASTTWWIDFNNFFEGVGALGGGNVTLTAGQSINNVDAVVPTNALMAGKNAAGNLIAPSAAGLVEYGGGDLVARAGNNINGGVYYVERGQGVLDAGGQIMTNATRTVVTPSNSAQEPVPYLPTTLYLGKGNFSLSAGGDLLLGSVVNPFLLPQGINNTNLDKSYFSTYAPTDSVTATSLSGQVTIKAGSSADSLLVDFYNDQVSVGTPKGFSLASPWLGLIEANVTDSFALQASLLPSTVEALAFSGDINLPGNLTLSPSPTGNLNLVAAGSINAFQPLGLADDGTTALWGSSRINLSDTDPNRINGITTPLSYTGSPNALAATNSALFGALQNLFNVSGSTTGSNALLSTEQQLHAALPINSADPNSATGPLHANDTTPIHLYAATGNIDGLSLFSGKFVDAVAGNDLMNIAFYVQNVNSSDITLIQAGRDIIAYDENSLLRQETHQTGGIYKGENHDSAKNASDNSVNGTQFGGPNTGDIQIAGPGTLEVLAGRNLTLGGLEDAFNKVDGTGFGIVSIGNTLNPALAFSGANVIAAAGIGGSSQATTNLGLSGFGLDATNNSLLNFAGFENLFLNPNPSAGAGAEAAIYLPVLGTQMGLTDSTNAQIWDAFQALPIESQAALASTIFYDVLRDAGRNHNNPNSPDVGTYNQGYVALNALFPTSNTYQGDISLTAREIKTTNVGAINLFAPGGGIDVGINNNGSQAVDQGILTVSGGSISIFADKNVAVGTSRIFTLHGGDEIIWSTHGNIAAGASSKTVQSAPPTRVLIDPTSGNVQTDLAGLATGGGIGVLETVEGAPPGNVDLIAPSGIVDAGDAGIRSSGNINIAAATILNAGNIQSGGSTSGVAAAPTPNIGASVAAASAGGSSQNAANEAGRQQQSNQSRQDDLPSIISVQVIGYSAGESADASSPSTDQLLARNGAR